MALNRRVLLAPHFPALLRDTAASSESRVQEALRAVGERWRRDGVEVVVALSACWDTEGPFQVDNGGRLKTLQDMAGVQARLSYTCDGWPELANALHDNAMENGLPVETVHRGMDHGAAVPLSYLFPDADRRVVALSVGERSRDDMTFWGEIVRETCRGAGAEIAVLAGGSLSYDAEAHARGDDREGGVELDRTVLGHLEAGDWKALAGLDPGLMARAGAHAGLRHLGFLEGVLDGSAAGRVLAYHRHPSVGSAVVEFEQSA